MSRPDAVVIDYGMGNLMSVRRGLEYCGASVEITSDPNAILAASKIILPGVGAFSNGMSKLDSLGLSCVIREAVARGRFLLGICLGMQMLLEQSEEFGITRGLGLIPGCVVPIPTKTIDSKAQKIPHIGWNDLVMSHEKGTWDGTILQDAREYSSVYFVHSFMAEPISADYRIADCLYGGLKISAVIGCENIYGCQFHPEKSGEVGLNILKKFLML
jgi:imidazole glycerol-phosphate synthase subunit HisH